jgi:simple sugar transport system permease protein
MPLEELLRELFSQTIFVGLLAATIRMATPLLFTSLGQIFAQSAGVLDLSVEGVMLMGAFWGFVGSYFTGHLWLGVAAGMLSGVIINLLLALIGVTLRASQGISSIMLVIMTSGLVIFLNRVIFGGTNIPPRTAGFQALHFPILSDIPIVGPVLFQQNVLVYVAFALVPLVGIVIYRTTFGLSVKAVGEHPAAADSVGITPNRMKYIAIIIGGLFAGLGGAFLTLAYTNTFTDIITAGRGWVALSLVIFGRWNPYRVMLGALMFGFINALQLRLQALLGSEVAFHLMLMLPYLLALVVLTRASQGAAGPAALATHYSRE